MKERQKNEQREEVTRLSGLKNGELAKMRRVGV